jgi:DNA-binding MarR family transcriptional regulator
VTSPKQTAALTLEVIPSLTRLIRSKFREKRMGNLTMVEFRTMTFIDANQGASLSDAADHIGLGRPSMSKLVDALVNRKRVTRNTHGKDRRRICLALTKQGKRDLDEAYQHTQLYFANEFSSLSEKQRSQIADALTLMQSVFALGTNTSDHEPMEQK